MGATGSIIIPTSLKPKLDEFVYKKKTCGCFLKKDNKNNIELLFSCYFCLEKIKNKNLDILNLDNDNNDWITEKEAIEYAEKNKIPICEFINNKNILMKYDF